MPTSTIRIEMTMATMGRLIKNFDMGHSPPAAAAESTNGLGFTCIPSFTFIKPCATIFSPALRPSVMTQLGPTRSPTFTVRKLTLLSAPTTTT